jgi:signal peptidase I
VAALVPIWNVVVVLKMVGRPVSHLAFFLVPFYNIYFFFRLCVELAQSFGKYSLIDYVLVCVFNVFYVLNLALAYNEEYQGPVYGTSRAHHAHEGELAAG